MKKNSILAMAAALCICFGFAGCGENSDSTADAAVSSAAESEADSASEESSEADTPDEDTPDADAPAEDAGEETGKEAAFSFAPSQEILDAPLDSGYVQICDDIFRTGGYLTVNDFVEQYSDHWTLEECDLSKVMENDIRYVKAYNKKSDDLEIELCCTKPPVEGGTVGDAVVVKIKTGGIAEYSWFPGGYQCWNGHNTLNEIRAVYQEAGYTEVVDEKTSGKAKDKVGMCFIHTIEGQENNYTNSESLAAFTELDAENLYGVKPILSLYYGMTDPVDADQTMNDLRTAVEAGQNGEVVEDPGIATEKEKRFSYCTFNLVCYKENESIN